ncbi:MAG: glutamate--tRNA ligase, partial [Chloroflexota bacterium]
FVARMMPLVQERAKTLAEIPALTDFLFFDQLDYDAALLIGKKMDAAMARQALSVSLQRVEPLAAFDEAALEEKLRPLAEELGMKTGQLFGTLRVAVTGRTVAPPLFQTMAVLGREKCLSRIATALKRLPPEEA